MFENKERLINTLMFNHIEPMLDLNLGKSYVDEVFSVCKDQVMLSDNRCLYSDDKGAFNKYNEKSAEKYRDDFENKIAYLIRNCKTDDNYDNDSDHESSF